MDRKTDHWQARLPAPLQAHVVMPVRVEVHRDDETPATKWRGYDALGQLCWYRHHYAQWDAGFEADDEPVAQLLHEEDFEAWRSLPGSWIRRVQRLQGDGKPCGVASDTGFEVVDATGVPRS